MLRNILLWVGLPIRFILGTVFGGAMFLFLLILGLFFPDDIKNAIGRLWANTTNFVCGGPAIQSLF